MTAADTHPPADPIMPTTLRDRVFGDAEANAVGIAALTLPQLRAIARGLGWPLTGLKRDDILAQMARHYADPASAAAAVDALPPDIRALLGVVAWLGPDARAHVIAAFDRLQAALPASARLAAPLNAGSAALTTALERGLLLGDDGTTPPTLRTPWPLSIALPPPAWTPTIKVPAGWRRERACDGVADLVAAGLALVAEGRVRAPGPFGEQAVDWHGHWPVIRGEGASAVGGVSSRTMRIPAAASPLSDAARAVVARAVGDPDEERGAFIVAQLAGLGLLKTEGRHGALIDAAAFELWLTAAPADRLAGAILCWPHLPYPTWDEVSRLVRADGRLQHRRSVDMWRHNLHDYNRSRLSLRLDTLFGLHRLPRQIGRADAGWVDGPALARLVTAARPAHFLPTLDRDGWHIADNNGRPLGRDTDAGSRVAGALFASLLRGPLRWLGLVETAVAPIGGAWAVRLSPLGRAVVTGDETALAKTPQARWDERSTTVSLSLGWNTTAALDVVRQCGAYVGPARLDAMPGAVAFRIGPDTLQRVFSEGAPPPDVAARFAAAGMPLPTALQEDLAKWWSSWGTVNRYDDLALIEVADEHLAKVLRATTALDEALVYQVGPTCFVVPEAAVEGLLDQLRRAGHTPRVDEGVGADDGAAPAAGDGTGARDTVPAQDVAAIRRALRTAPEKRGLP